jgi:hypothetical protein
MRVRFAKSVEQICQSPSSAIGDQASCGGPGQAFEPLPEMAISGFCKVFIGVPFCLGCSSCMATNSAVRSPQGCYLVGQP